MHRSMLLISFIFIQTAFSQPIDPWKITAMNIDPSKYYGVTVANGMIGLIEYHYTAWDELWKSDITIEGDPQSQQDVHNMLYHLYSFIREGTAYSPSPIALSGLGYNGHVFWDLEFGYPIPARLPRGIYWQEVGGGTSFLKFIN